MENVAATAAGYAEADYLTIIDGVVIPEWFLEPLRGALRAASRRVAYAVLRAPLATCLERVQAREGQPPIDREALSRLWQSFSELGELEANVIDVDGRSVEETVDLLGRRFADGSLMV